MSDEGCIPVTETTCDAGNERLGSVMVRVSMTPEAIENYASFVEGVVSRTLAKYASQRPRFLSFRFDEPTEAETDPLDVLYPPSDEAPGIGDS